MRDRTVSFFFFFFAMQPLLVHPSSAAPEAKLPTKYIEHLITLDKLFILHAVNQTGDTCENWIVWVQISFWLFEQQLPQCQ